MRTFVSRRPAWTAHGLQPVEIVVQARGSVHAATLIRAACDERFEQYGSKRRPAKHADDGDRSEKRRRRPARKVAA